MLAFNNPILLWDVDATSLMDNTINTKELMQFSGQKSSTVVTMNLRDIEVELIFAKGKEKLEKTIWIDFMP